MLILDLAIATALLYGMVKGLWAGFFAEFAALISFFLGIYIALWVSGSLKDFLEQHTQWQGVEITVVAFGIPFLLTIVAVSLLARWFTSVFTMAGLGPANKIGGGFIGLFKTALIISIALNLFFNLNSGGFFATREQLEQSMLFNPVRHLGASIYPVLEEWYLRN